jgi:DNA (cytosine-5)-methyltransferase 1
MERYKGIDIICGGFPCQDISIAGSQRGISGERSGLWWDMFSLIKHLRPRYAIIENVGNLPRRGLLEILHCLASIGYDAEWDCISAAELGAPHTRKRYIIVAYPSGKRCDQRAGDRKEGRILHNKIWVAEKNKPEWNGWFCRFGKAFQAMSWRVLASEIYGVDDGVSEGLDKDRIKACGNAVLPQIPEKIFKRIVQITNTGVTDD